MQEALLEGFPLSPQQRRLCSTEDSHGSAYRVEGAVRIEGSVRTDVLKSALLDVVSRHEILRTTFRRLAGMKFPLQVIREAGISWDDDVDLSCWDPGEREERLEQLFNELRRYSFDLANGPLLRATHVSLSSNVRILLMSLPALCSDVAALNNIMRQLSRAYAMRLGGGALSDEPMQYADLAEWQNELVRSEDPQAGAYWSKQDFSLLGRMAVPYEDPPLGESSFKPRILPTIIAPDIARKIDGLAAAYGASSEVVLLACWQSLFWRLTGESDVVIGVLHDGRTHEVLEAIPGLFAKYLPIRCRFEGPSAFSEILAEICQTKSEASEHQEHFAWERIAQANAGGADDGSLFPVVFDFAEPSRPCSDGGATFALSKHYGCIDRFKIKLLCERRDDSLIAEFHYDDGRFRRKDIERLAAQFQALLVNALDHPKEEVRNLKIIGDAERRELLVEWNNTKRDYPKGRFVHQLFEEQASRTPDALAVVFEDLRLTYGELDARANQLAHCLKKRGVGPDDLIGIFVERSAEMVVGLLGIMKAGGAYVPLDAALPKGRLARILADTGVSVLLTQERLMGSIPQIAMPKLILLDGDWEVIAEESKRSHASYLDDHNLAYVIHTSGSTGNPKGVMVPHRAIRNYLFWMAQTYPLSRNDRVLQTVPFGFDVSLREIFWPLLTGAAVVVIRPETYQDIMRLVEFVEKYQITHIRFPPSMLQLFLEEPEIEGSCRSVKRVFCGGESMSVAVLERFFSRLHAELHNTYGPTEAAVNASAWVCERNFRRQTVPIGRPIANTVIYILDRELELVPTGVPGELHIGGEGLARGYFHMPDETADKFIPDPFAIEPGRRLYKTGDLARYLPDGNIEFLGRIDNQIKIRGFRVELEEIEAALHQYPEIRQVAVITRQNESGENRILAYIAPGGENKPSPHELRSFLQERLPEYMVPTSFAVLDALPLSPNGKIDRRGLPLPDLSKENRTDFVAPRTPVENDLAVIWAELLNIREVGVQSNFFDLGGHSLLVIRVAFRIRAHFQIDLPLRTFFENPTVEELAEVIAEKQRHKSDDIEADQILAKIVSLSDEEVQQRLTGAKPGLKANIDD